MNITPGTYEHFKGKTYEVIGVGHHSETLEELVFYRTLYKSGKFASNALWARPLALFIDVVEVNGETIPRFKKYEG